MKAVKNTNTECLTTFNELTEMNIFTQQSRKSIYTYNLYHLSETVLDVDFVGVNFTCECQQMMDYMGIIMNVTHIVLTSTGTVNR